MANSKTSEKDIEKILEYKNAGLSLADIGKRVSLSKSQVGKIINFKRDDQGADSAEKKQLIQMAIDLQIEKETVLNETALFVHNELVEERTADLRFIRELTYKNLGVLSKKINRKTSIPDHLAIQNAIAKGRDSLVGKDPAPPPVTNNLHFNTGSFTQEEIIERLNKANEYRRIIESARSPE